IAIRRDVEWIFGPSGDETLAAGDVLFLQGPEEGVDLVRELAGAPRRDLAEPAEKTLTGLDRAVDLLVEMKNSSEVAVGLAYSAILFHDKALAETDEIVAECTVAEGSSAAGRSLRALSLRTETGMDVLAIQRGGRWIYRPRGSTTFQAGDRILTVGPEDGAAVLEDMCTGV